MESITNQSVAWSGLITRCLKLAKDYESGNPFFAATAQGIKAKFDNSELVRGSKSAPKEGDATLLALVTPFFQETTYPTVKKVMVPKPEGERGKKLVESFEDGPRKKAPSIYQALQRQIAIEPENEALQVLFDDIEAQATELPSDIKNKLGLAEVDVDLAAQAAVTDVPEHVS